MIASPAALTATLHPLATAWLTYLAAGHGTAVVAAVGVVARVEALAMTGIRGLSVVLIPFMGQNLGAGLHRRILEGYRKSLRFSLIWSVLTAVALAVAAQAIASAFTIDPQVQRHIVHLLWIVPWTYGFGGWLLLAANAANGLARPGQATLMSVFRLVVAMGLLGWLGARWGGALGLFAAMAVGNVAAGVFAVYRFRACLEECH
jgi:Na+-driven multidrug efflux pump